MENVRCVACSLWGGLMKRALYRIASLALSTFVIAVAVYGEGVIVVPSLPEPSYPQFVLDPISPSAEDSVSLNLILGVHPNSCVPQYSTSYSVDQFPVMCFAPPCPSEYVITVQYAETQKKIGAGMICMEVLTPFGPTFDFGKLNAGSYTVVDDQRKDTLVTFTVTEKPGEGRIRGVVSEDVGALEIFSPIPKAKVYLQQPSYVLLDNMMKTGAVSWPYIPQEIVDSTTSGDDGSFVFEKLSGTSYSLRVAAEGYQTKTLGIILPGDSIVGIKLLKTGAYAAVEGTVKGQSCLSSIAQDGIACAPVALERCTVTVTTPGWGLMSPIVESGTVVYMPQRLFTAVTDANGYYKVDSIPLTQNGEPVLVTFSKSGYIGQAIDTTLDHDVSTLVDAILQADGPVDIALERPSAGVEPAGIIQFSPKDKMLSIRVDRAQMVAIDAFLSNGRREGRLSTNRHFGPGVYRFSMNSKDLGSGMVIVRVRGEDFEETKRINLSVSN